MSRPRPTILVVEDDDDIALLVSATLGRTNARLYHAIRGSEALTLVDELAPDVITVDLSMPDLVGTDLASTELVQRIREKTRAYILVLSARTTPADEASALSAGADSYLSKPFSPRRLRELVDTALHGGLDSSQRFDAAS